MLSSLLSRASARNTTRIPGCPRAYWPSFKHFLAVGDDDMQYFGSTGPEMFEKAELRRATDEFHFTFSRNYSRHNNFAGPRLSTPMQY
jgi:hypothetical protein